MLALFLLLVGAAADFDPTTLKLIVSELDANSDGLVSDQELTTYFGRQHRRMEIDNSTHYANVTWALFIEDLMVLDQDNDQSLSRAEILGPTKDEDEKVKELAGLCFDFADVDGDGKFEAKEYAVYTTVVQSRKLESLMDANEAVVAPVVKEVMAAVDTNKDSKLSFSEIEANVFELLRPLAEYG
jgi:hypothetical protein